MSTPTWAPAIAGQNALADQLNQFLGMHAMGLCYAGSAIASNLAAQATTYSSNAQWLAQPFVLSGTEVDGVQLYGVAAVSGADVTVSLRADNAGSPGATDIVALTLPREFPGTSARWITVPLRATGLTSGSTYWLVVSMGGDATNHLVLGAAGSASPSLNTSTDGTTWAATTTQLCFAVLAGNSGSLLAATEDGGARWSELCYNASGQLVVLNEYTGAFRSSRALTYDATGVLTGVL